MKASHLWTQSYKRSSPCEPWTNSTDARTPATCHSAAMVHKMVSINLGILEKTVVLFFICILFYSTYGDSKPLGKRAINEVQLMHNLGVHKHVEMRQDWLQMKLREIHTASEKKSQEKTGLLPDIVSNLKDLNPREAEDIIAVLEKLMNPS
ncbi:parathyroid hormone 1a [Puntigrus tetrazona]|uniref:parathyroid hormone 1a n=1 Tax=Puntigrus tetrazona TaxID=1606681 RepID=UPI001C8AD863|nr:parathyroid hormone 1a [Puntigrus tetrazona]